MNDKKPVEDDLAQEQQIQEKQEISEPQDSEQPEYEQLQEEAGKEDSAEELMARIEQLNEELGAAKDKSLRAAAEIENIRRRSANEQINVRKYAIEGFAAELLAVKDSLDLAEQVELSADNKDVIVKMHEGLALTLKQLDRTFEKFSIEAINPEKGDKLDPELHQAMTVQPSDEVENNCVLSVIQKGYRLHDRLLRPAMVVIARKPEEKKDDPEGEKA